MRHNTATEASKDLRIPGEKKFVKVAVKKDFTHLEGNRRFQLSLVWQHCGHHKFSPLPVQYPGFGCFSERFSVVFDAVSTL